MTTALLLILTALSVARVTRLVNKDILFERPRGILLERWGDKRPMLAYLIVCPWCLSVYVSALAAAAGAMLEWWPWSMTLPAALAFSYVTGFLAEKESE